MGQTSEQWWKAVSADKRRIAAWLRKQAYGEAQACFRINQLIVRFPDMSATMKAKILHIATDEATHAQWLLELLRNRSEKAPMKKHSERYWKKVYKFDTIFEACAVATHAEEMRLERIRVICADITAPWDIRDVFLKILADEEKHARMFKSMCAPQDYEWARKGHEVGMKALGLVI